MPKIKRVVIFKKLERPYGKYTTRMVEKVGALAKGEFPLEVEFNLPDSFFEKHIVSTSITVPDDTPMKEIKLLTANIEKAVMDACEIKIDVQIVKAKR